MVVGEYRGRKGRGGGGFILWWFGQAEFELLGVWAQHLIGLLTGGGGGSSLCMWWSVVSLKSNVQDAGRGE